MAVELKLPAEKRSDTGKGASRRLRREKLVPGIVYGAGKDAEMIQVSAFELARMMETESFYSQVIDLTVKGKKAQGVVVKDLQRHPFKDRVLHVDFLRVKAGEKLHMHVPLHFLNDETCKGVKAGGVVHKDSIEVSIIALPKDLPEYIEVDLADLEIGDSLHLSDLKMPPNVELEAFAHGDDTHDADQPVVSIVQPRVSKLDEAAEEAEAAVAEEQAEESAEEEASGDEEEKKEGGE
ncbi:large subunit ribosomal protein L25 [Natronocella acetinitrilica]|uniref:Large ribosomal subunit protein bL25 n=1 Tax=Natronocella acetinitrilica TaxID=414046 RepID=A0AAE3G0B2_9GAMM|nr:50S ribosomal protein L25/general stress protein Ctc [Natronocella acetinitrilica]MCP1672947.1 large subunit ribosomal protein L25 [Natronocella acetinitrilica]